MATRCGICLVVLGPDSVPLIFTCEVCVASLHKERASGSGARRNALPIKATVIRGC